MKKNVAALALAAMLVAQAGVGAFADDALAAAGPTTAGGNAVWKVVTFPFRIVTTVSSGAVGLVAGGLKGVVGTEEKFAVNTFGKMDQNPALVVPGVLGTVVAVPVGFVAGAPAGAVKGAKGGYQWWDTF